MKDTSGKRNCRWTCCDTTVAVLSALVILASVFRDEVTWFLSGG